MSTSHSPSPYVKQNVPSMCLLARRILTGVDDDMATPANPFDGTQAYSITLTIDRTNTADDTYDTLAPVTVASVLLTSSS